MRSADFAGWACLVLLLLSAGTAVGQGKMPCTISLANGDQLQADLVRIHEGKAFFRPVVAPEAGMQLPIENVESVRYAAPSTGARSEGHTDTLRLLDGSVFRGTFRRLGEEWIQFDFEDSGSIRVPRRALDELSRGANGACGGR